MPVPKSAGLLLYRRVPHPWSIEVLLVHPGGPLWAKKDDHAWSIPKGEVDVGEAPLRAARREFEEELGEPSPDGPYHSLGEVHHTRKVVLAWAVEGDFDAGSFPRRPVSTVEIEWPPRSGRRLVVPEVDRVEWFLLEKARPKLHRGQAELLDRLLTLLRDGPPGARRS